MSIKADLFEVKGTIAVPINPPPIPGLGSTGGFEFQIQDFESKGPVALEAMTQKFIAKAMARDSIGNLLTEFSVDHPVIDLDINRLEAERLGVSHSKRLPNAERLLWFLLRQQLEQVQSGLPSNRASGRFAPALA